MRTHLHVHLSFLVFHPLAVISSAAFLLLLPFSWWEFSTPRLLSWVLILPGNEQDDSVQYICECFDASDYTMQSG